LPDLTRRVVVLTFLGAVAVSLLAPVSAQSSTPLASATGPLLGGMTPEAASAERGTIGRELSASLSLARIRAPIGPENLDPSDVIQGLAVIPMKATTFPRTTAAKVAAPPSGGTTVSGRATWYCCSLGWRGVAVVALPGALGGHYDGPPAANYVTVCADRCVELPIVDYCGCSWGTASQKVADLSPEAWAAITDKSLSMGVVSVTLHFAG
jgi:hypothetical protein